LLCLLSVLVAFGCVCSCCLLVRWFVGRFVLGGGGWGWGWDGWVGLGGGGKWGGEELLYYGEPLNCREAQVFCNGFRSIRAYRDQEITVCQSPCFPVGCRTLSAQVRINSTKVRFQRLMKYGLKQTSGVINASQS